MNQIVSKESCCGCGACMSACNHEAIYMQYDDEGFEYPEIRQNSCVDCGLCLQVCPVFNFNYERSKLYSSVQKGYIAKNNCYGQRIISSSGSIFPPLAEWVLEKGGIVIGTAFDEQFDTVHLIVDNKDDLVKLQGSKYLQCKVDKNTFKIIEKELQNDRIVLYSGLACQVEGLKSYLKKEFQNLYTIDLICMGIPSSVVWQKYLHAFFPRESIVKVNFKEKSIGWSKFCVKIETDKRNYIERGMENLYLQSMFHTYNMRRSCFCCPFKKAERRSDFTIADAWGVSKQATSLNDEKGLSSVIVHSPKGLVLWEKLGKRIESKEIGVDDIEKGNENLVKCKESASDRMMFYQLLDQNPDLAFLKMCSVKKPSIIVRFLKGLCCSIKKSL